MAQTRGTEDTHGGTRRPDEVTVLVVDDEPDVLTYLSSVLEDAGMRVLTATDGELALAVLAREKVDMISLDLVMPRKSGIRVIHELRRNSEWSRIPLVIVTGHAHDRDVRDDLDQIMAGSVMSGSAMYLEKPVTPQRYLEHICRVLHLDCSAAETPMVSPSNRLREEAEALLAAADAATLAEVLKTLKHKGQ